MPLVFSNEPFVDKSANHLSKLAELFCELNKKLSNAVVSSQPVFVRQSRAFQDGAFSALFKSGNIVSCEFDGHGGEIDGVSVFMDTKIYQLAVQIIVRKVAFMFREVRTKAQFETALFEAQAYLASDEYEFFKMGFTYAISVYNPMSREGMVYRMGDVGLYKVSQLSGCCRVVPFHQEEITSTDASAFRQPGSSVANILAKYGYTVRRIGNHLCLKKDDGSFVGSLVANVAMTDFGLDVAEILYREGVCRIHSFSLKKNEFFLMGSDGLEDYAYYYKQDGDFLQRWLSTAKMPKIILDRETDDCSATIVGLRTKALKKMLTPEWL